jgi:uncharacterized protein
MLTRHAQKVIQSRLTYFPAVALLGPRQCGKTTLARTIVDQLGAQATYLDLERPDDLALLTDAPLFLRTLSNKLVVIDEVQRAPELFQTLRVQIDERRRAGEKAGHFLLLGSASRELLRQSSESLAGRIDYLELTPLRLDELNATDGAASWFRGGYPDSLLAPDDAMSHTWRRAYLSQMIERDVPFFAPRIPGPMLRRLLSMLAYDQGGLLNSARLAQSLGMSAQSINRYLALMVELFHVRSLPAWSGKTTKRLTKSPKVFIRDSGLLHALIDIADQDMLVRHPVVGASFEGFVIEHIINMLGTEWQFSFYRTQHGAEIDLICERGGERIAIEIKRSTRPVPSAGFYDGCEIVKATQRWLVHAGEKTIERDAGFLSLPWSAVANRLAGLNSALN